MIKRIFVMVQSQLCATSITIMCNRFHEWFPTTLPTSKKLVLASNHSPSDRLRGMLTGLQPGAPNI